MCGMPQNPLFYDATIKALVNAVTGLLPGGSLKIYTGSQPALNGPLTGTLLVSFALGTPAFANAVASAGTVTATAGLIPQAAAGGEGTAGFFALLTSGSAVVMTGSTGTSGADLNMNSTSIPSGAILSIGSLGLATSQS